MSLTDQKIYNYNEQWCIDEALEKARVKRITEAENKKYTRLIFFDQKKYEDLHKVKIDGIHVDFVYIDQFRYEIYNDQIIIYNSLNSIENPIYIEFNENESTVIYGKVGYSNDEFVSLLNKLNDLGFLVINDPKYVNVSANKLLTCKLFDYKHIPQPKYNVIYRHDVDKDTDEDILTNKLRDIYKDEDDNNVFVCKILSGHGGHGVFLCKEHYIRSVLQCMFSIDKSLKKLLIQEKIDIKDGDIRAYVLNLNGQQHIIECIMRTKSNGDFRTNLSLGNELVPYKLDEEEASLVKRVAKISGLTFIGVDMCKDNTLWGYKKRCLPK